MIMAKSKGKINQELHRLVTHQPSHAISSHARPTGDDVASGPSTQIDASLGVNHEWITRTLHQTGNLAAERFSQWPFEVVQQKSTFAFYPIDCILTSCLRVTMDSLDHVSPKCHDWSWVKQQQRASEATKYNFALDFIILSIPTTQTQRPK